MQRMIVRMTVLAATTFAVSAAMAGTIVTPSSSAASVGDSQGPAPLRYYGTGGSRVQQEYDSALFNSTLPQLISKIEFRPFTDPSAFSSNTVNVSNIVVRLSTTQAFGEGANQLSATFANNVGPDVTTVYAGQLSLSTFNGPGTSPRAFDYTINLQTPFVYNPALGNLLLDVQIPTTASVSGSGFGFVTFDSVNATNDGIYSVVDINNGNAATGTASTAGAITRFTTTEVPEPTAVVLIVLSTFIAPFSRKLRRYIR